MSTIVKTVTTNVIKRDWSSIEPKLLAVLAGLATSTALTALAGLFHFPITPTEAVAGAAVISLLVGYLKHSTEKFPVAEAVKDSGALVAAIAPTTAPAVAEVEAVIAPAIDTPTDVPSI